MSGECNWCGGEHAEDACDARRELVYENGRRSGYADGWNDRNKGVTLGREVVEKVREAISSIPITLPDELRARGMDFSAKRIERAIEAIALLPKDSPHA